MTRIKNNTWSRDHWQGPKLVISSRAAIGQIGKCKNLSSDNTPLYHLNSTLFYSFAHFLLNPLKYACRKGSSTTYLPLNIKILIVNSQQLTFAHVSPLQKVMVIGSHEAEAGSYLWQNIYLNSEGKNKIFSFGPWRFKGAVQEAS